eukprot:836719-Karenia_brevis.AAC.1
MSSQKGGCCALLPHAGIAALKLIAWSSVAADATASVCNTGCLYGLLGRSEIAALKLRTLCVRQHIDTSMS